MLWILASLASAQTCARTAVSTIAALPSPTVLVLGERKGTLPDLSRAATIVNKRLAKGPVTVALQAVHRDAQPELDKFAAGTLPLEALRAAADWDERWGFPFEAYAKLLNTRSKGVKLVAIGVDYGLRPPEATVQLPPGYIAILADAMGDAPVPVELETTTVETMAWADQQLAAKALEAWDGQGTLVIVVDRFHVEGGLGVQWQAERQAQAPVHAVILANADSRCYPSDQLLP